MPSKENVTSKEGEAVNVPLEQALCLPVLMTANVPTVTAEIAKLLEVRVRT